MFAAVNVITIAFPFTLSIYIQFRWLGLWGSAGLGVFPQAVAYVRKVLFPLYWSEVLFVSAETGEGVAKIWTAVDAAVNQVPAFSFLGLISSFAV